MSHIEYEGRLYIDGEFREAKSGKRYDVINPADESWARPPTPASTTRTTQ